MPSGDDAIPIEPARDAAALFASRLATLAHLLDQGARHFRAEPDACLALRLAPDMLPLAAQVAFTCNQPRNFCLWLDGGRDDNLDPQVPSLERAHTLIGDTRMLLERARARHAHLPERKHLVLGEGLRMDLTGTAYLRDFLLPNFHFHLVAAYAVLRMAGVPLGKGDYMLHLQSEVEPTRP